jgi:hypothetical protein
MAALSRLGRAVCQCGHGEAAHDLGVRGGEKRRTQCSVTDAHGQCRCRLFTLDRQWAGVVLTEADEGRMP